MTSKYDPLENFLREKTTHREVSLSLAQIETIIGAALPISAYKHREWWSNQSDVSNRPHAQAWIAAGFNVDSINKNTKITGVRFVRR